MSGILVPCFLYRVVFQATRLMSLLELCTSVCPGVQYVSFGEFIFEGSLVLLFSSHGAIVHFGQLLAQHVLSNMVVWWYKGFLSHPPSTLAGNV